MALAVADAGSQASTASAVAIGAQQTASGVYVLSLNLTPMVNGDEIEIVAQTKVVTGGSEAVYATYRFLHAQGPKVWQTVPIASPYAITFTIKRIAGSDRTYEYAILSL